MRYLHFYTLYVVAIIRGKFKRHLGRIPQWHTGCTCSGLSSIRDAWTMFDQHNWKPWLIRRGEISAFACRMSAEEIAYEQAAIDAAKGGRP